MPARPRPPRIAVLGGGLGALSAVWYLTSRPDWKDHYEIDVYQLGWRLGGKGACGRNPDAHQRIEEHGLHILFGFYDNGLRMLRALYDELGRPPDAAMPTFDAAFTGHDLITLTDEYTLPGEDPCWTFRMPTVGSEDGDAPQRSLGALLSGRLRDAVGLLPDAETDLRGLPALMAGLISLLRELLSADDLRQITRHTLHQLRHGELELEALAFSTARLLSHLTAIDVLGENPLGALLERASDRLAPLLGQELYRDDPRIPDWQEAIAEVAAAVLEGVNLVLSASWGTTRWRRLLMLGSLGLSIVRGIFRDMPSLWAPDWFSLDDLSFEDWLIKHGCEARTARSCLTRVLRQVGFAEQQGAGAGTTLHWAMRMVLDYEGRFMYKMNAGMGDVIFVPFYRVLQQRGVRFHFFHRVDEVLHNDQGSVHQVRLGRPVQVRAGATAYDPLVTVKGLECWPDRPRFDQLVEGEALARCWDAAPLDMDLENWWTAWRDRHPPLTLHKGQDFDHVILGISVAALPEICRTLCSDPRNPAFGEMARGVVTTQTRAFQLWLKTDLHGLGFRSGEALEPGNWSPVLGTYPARFDTWSDTTLVEPWEDWPAGEVRHVAYWCAGMPDEDDLPLPPRGPGRYLHRQHDRCFANLVAWAGYNVAGVWPLAAEPPLHQLVTDGIEDEAQMERGTLFTEAARLSNLTDGGGAQDLPPQRSLRMDLLAFAPPTEAAEAAPCPDALPPLPPADQELAALAAAPALAALRGQYWRVPFYPSERYVLSVPGSVQKRLAPWESGYDNLFLVGDWTLSPISAGCVEATVQSAAMCAQAIAGTPEKIDGYWLRKQPPPPVLWLPPLPGEEPSLIPPVANPLPAPPYTAHRTRLQAFLLRADRDALTRVCDQQLNLPGSPVEFRPIGDFAMFVAANIARFDTAQPQASTPERDFGFWIPVYQGHRSAGGHFRIDSLAFFLPALWVEPALAITAGREVFGYQKSEGRITGPCSADEAQYWKVEGLAVPRYGPPTGQPDDPCGYRWTPLVEIRPTPQSPARAPSAWERLENVGQGLVRRLVGQERRPTPEEELRTDEDFLRVMLSELRGLKMPMVYLKQFPSVANPQRACYQAICRSENVVLGDFNMHRIPGPHTLTLHPQASCDLGARLGLPTDVDGQLQVSLALHMEFDFLVQLGQVLHDVRHPG